MLLSVPHPAELPNRKAPVLAIGSNENGLVVDVLSTPKMVGTDEAVVDGRPNENPPFGMQALELVNKALVKVVVVAVDVDIFEMGITKLLLTGSDVCPGAMPNVKSLWPVPEEGIPNLKEAWFVALPGISLCVTS